jgi:hypothetical protein
MTLVEEKVAKQSNSLVILGIDIRLKERLGRTSTLLATLESKNWIFPRPLTEIGSPFAAATGLIFSEDS